MPKGTEFNPGEPNKYEIGLRSPKTVRRWCDLYCALSGKDVFPRLNMENGKAERLLTFEQFKEEMTNNLTVDLKNLSLIADVSRLIEKNKQ